MKISKQKLKHIYEVLDKENISYLQETMSDWFPKLFPKSELEVGKWYKYEEQFMFCFSGKIGDGSSYGFNFAGIWTDLLGVHEPESYTPATDKEVEEALDKQADKIGYKEGDNIGNFNGLKNETITSDSKSFSGGLLFRGGCCVFEKGKWATIIDQPKKLTVEEVEKELGYKVEIIS